MAADSSMLRWGDRLGLAANAFINFGQSQILPECDRRRRNWTSNAIFPYGHPGVD